MGQVRGASGVGVTIKRSFDMSQACNNMHIENLSLRLHSIHHVFLGIIISIYAASAALSFGQAGSGKRR